MLTLCPLPFDLFEVPAVFFLCTFIILQLPDGVGALSEVVVGFVAGGATLLWALPRLAARRGLVLQATVDQLMPALTLSVAGGGGETAMPFDGLVAERLQSLTGATGEALSDLRPGGFALIDGQRVDVITRGEVIPRGARR